MVEKQNDQSCVLVMIQIRIGFWENGMRNYFKKTKMAPMPKKAKICKNLYDNLKWWVQVFVSKSNCQDLATSSILRQTTNMLTLFRFADMLIIWMSYYIIKMKETHQICTNRNVWASTQIKDSRLTYWWVHSGLHSNESRTALRIGHCRLEYTLR